MKLSKDEREFLSELQQGCLRNRGPDLWALWEMGLIYSPEDNPNGFYVTKAGRAVLEADDA